MKRIQEKSKNKEKMIAIGDIEFSIFLHKMNKLSYPLLTLSGPADLYRDG